MEKTRSMGEAATAAVRTAARSAMACPVRTGQVAVTDPARPTPVPQCAQGRSVAVVDDPYDAVDLCLGGGCPSWIGRRAAAYSVVAAEYGADDAGAALGSAG